MNTSFPTDGFGASSFGGHGSSGGIGGDMLQMFDQLRSSFEKRARSRMGRGDVREAVLALLSEQPMHGYQIMREIEKRSGGSWKPSAGSVYPTLQLLADEGAISTEEANGKKTYALTDSGREEAEAAAGSVAWQAERSAESTTRGALPKAGFELAQVAAQVTRTGSSEQVQEAVTVLEEARRRMYAILSQD